MMKRGREEENNNQDFSLLSSSSTQWEILYGLTSRYAKAYDKRRQQEQAEGGAGKRWPTTSHPQTLSRGGEGELAGLSSSSSSSSAGKQLGSGGISHALLPPSSFCSTSWAILVDCLHDTLCSTSDWNKSTRIESTSSASISSLHPLPPTIEMVRLVANDSTTLVCDRLTAAPSFREGGVEDEDAKWGGRSSTAPLTHVQYTVPQERGELLAAGDIVLVYDRICRISHSSNSSSSEDEDDKEEEEEEEEARKERKKKKKLKIGKGKEVEYRLERQAELLGICPSIFEESGGWTEAAHQGALAVLKWLAKLLSYPPGLGQLTYLVQCGTTGCTGRIGWMRALQLSRFLTSDVINVSALSPEEERVLLRLRRTVISALRALITVFHHVQLVQLPVPQRILEDLVLSPLFVDGFSMTFSLQSPTFLAPFELQGVVETFQDFVRRLVLPLFRSSRTVIGGRGGVVMTAMHGAASVATPAAIQALFFVVHRLADAHLSLLREGITSHPLVTATETFIRSGWTRDVMSWLREAEEDVEHFKDAQEHEVAAEKSLTAVGGSSSGIENSAWTNNVLSLWSTSPKRVIPLVHAPPSLRMIRQESVIAFSHPKRCEDSSSGESSAGYSSAMAPAFESFHSTGASLFDSRPHIDAMARTYDPYRTKEALNFVEAALVAAYVELYGPASRSAAALLSYLSWRKSEKSSGEVHVREPIPVTKKGTSLGLFSSPPAAVSSFFPAACILPVLTARQTSTPTTIPLHSLHSMGLMDLRCGARYGLPLHLELDSARLSPSPGSTTPTSLDDIQQKTGWGSSAERSSRAHASAYERLCRVLDSYDISFSSSFRRHASGGATTAPIPGKAMGEKERMDIDGKGSMFGYVVVVLQGNPVLFPVLLTRVEVAERGSSSLPQGPAEDGTSMPSQQHFSVCCTIYPLQDGDLLPSFASLARQTAALSLHSSIDSKEEGIDGSVWLVLGDESEEAEKEAENPLALLDTRRFFPLGTPAITYVDMIQRLLNIRRELQGLSKSTAWGSYRSTSSTTGSSSSSTSNNSASIRYNKSPEGLWLNYFATNTLPVQRLYAALLPSAAGLLTGNVSHHRNVLEEALDELKEAVPLTHWQIEAVRSLTDSTVASSTSTGLLRGSTSAAGSHNHSTSVLSNLRVVQGTVGSGKTVVMHGAGLVKGLQLAEGRREQQRGLQTVLQRTTSAVQEASSQILSASRLDDLESGEQEKETREKSGDAMDPSGRASPSPLQVRPQSEVAQEMLWSAVADQILAFESLSMGLQYCSTPLLIRTVSIQTLSTRRSSSLPNPLSSPPFLRFLFGDEGEQYTNKEEEDKLQSGRDQSPPAYASQRYRPEWLRYGKAPTLLTVVEEALSRTANAPLARVLGQKLQQLTKVAECCSAILGYMEEWESQEKDRENEEDSYVAPSPLYASVLPFLLSPIDHQAVSATAEAEGKSWGACLAERIWCNVPGGVVAAGGPPLKGESSNEEVRLQTTLPISPYWVSVELSFTKSPKEECPDPVAGNAFPSSTFTPVERTSTHRGLTELTADQAVGWHAVYRGKQLEWLKRVYAAALSTVQETLEFYEGTVYGVASASQTSKYPLVTTTGADILCGGLLPFLWHWSPSHVMIDDFDGLNDGLFLTLPAVSTLTLSSSLHLPGLLAQRRSAPRSLFTDLLTVLQKTAGGGASARTSLLRQIHRCHREEVHSLLQHYSAAPLQSSTLATSEEEGESTTANAWDGTKVGSAVAKQGEKDKPEEDTGPHLTPLPGLASFSAVEGWSHVLPPSRSLEGDAVAGCHLAQYFLRHRPDRFAFLAAYALKSSSAGSSFLSSASSTDGNRAANRTTSLLSSPLRFTVVTPFASDISPISAIYRRANDEKGKQHQMRRLPSSATRVPSRVVKDSGDNADPIHPVLPPSSHSHASSHSLHFACVPFHFDPMRLNTPETEEEIDVAIVHLSGILERLAKSSSSSSVSWWRTEEATPQGALAQRMECWLWRVLSRVRWGVVVLAGRELFARLPALGHLEREIIKNRETLSPFYSEEEEEEGSKGGTNGSTGAGRTSPKGAGTSDGGDEEEEGGETRDGMGSLDTINANTAAGKRGFWLPREVGCAVMGFQCGQHCKSRFIARVALSDLPEQGEDRTSSAPPPLFSTPEASSSTHPTTTVAPASRRTSTEKVHIITHGTAVCSSICALPYKHCSFSFHACLKPCHFLFRQLSFRSSSVFFPSFSPPFTLPLKCSDDVSRSRDEDEETKKEERSVEQVHQTEEEEDLQHLLESDDDDNDNSFLNRKLEEEAKGVEGPSTIRTLTETMPKRTGKTIGAKEIEEEMTEVEEEEQHSSCPYPCMRILPRCGHLCQRQCGEGYPPGESNFSSLTAGSTGGGGEEGGSWMGGGGSDGGGGAHGGYPNAIFTCPPCLVRGLTQLTCGQRVVSGVDPNDGKIQFETFTHFQTRLCGEGSSSPDDIPCEEPVTLTCRRCGIRSTTPCHVLQAAKVIGREREKKRATAREEVPRGKDEIDADTEDLLLEVVECRGCVNLVNRVLAPIEGYKPLVVPPEHCALPKFAIPRAEDDGENEEAEEGASRRVTPTSTMMPVTAKDCPFLPEALQGDNNVHSLLTAGFARETRKASLLLRKAALEISNGRYVENSPLSVCQNTYKRFLEIMEEEKKSREEVLQKKDEKLLCLLKEKVAKQVTVNLELEGEFPSLENEALAEFHRQEAVGYP